MAYMDCMDFDAYCLRKAVILDHSFTCKTVLEDYPINSYNADFLLSHDTVS